MKEDKAKALDMFNKGEGGFKDRDLYVWCAGSDGIVTATPYWNKGKQVKDIKGKHGAPFGETVMQNATEGTMWPRPGTDKPLEKTIFYTKVSRPDLRCRLLQELSALGRGGWNRFRPATLFLWNGLRAK